MGVAASRASASPSRCSSPASRSTTTAADDAKIGILVASVVAAIAGAVVLSVAARRTRGSDAEAE